MIRRFAYEYDFGDSWRHTVEVEEVREERDDCGGPHGYGRLLDVLFDPTHPEFEELRHWVGRGFEPERFDLWAVNAALSAVPWQG